MSEQCPASAKVYSTENLGNWSILDMLAYFEEKGAMRVSDLHIKIGAPPVYRIDGDLVKLKGLTVTEETEREILEGILLCARCNVEYPIHEGIPNLLPRTTPE